MRQQKSHQRRCGPTSATMVGDGWFIHKHKACCALLVLSCRGTASEIFIQSRKRRHDAVHRHTKTGRLGATAPVSSHEDLYILLAIIMDLQH